MTADQNYGAAMDQSYSGESGRQTLSVWALTALVVGSMVGAGAAATA